VKSEATLLDSTGREICPGDLLRSPHFIGARRKQYYLYHTAVMRDGRMRMVPTCHLEPTKAGGGGDCLLSASIAKTTTIIQGYGPGDILSFEDRPKRSALSQPAEGESDGK